MKQAPEPVQFIHEKKVPAKLAAGSAYLSFMPEYFKNDVIVLHQIRSKIADRFGVNVRDINFCGSAHLLYSYIKKTDFTPGQSDLDVAIVSQSLFAAYYDKTLEITSGLADQTKFDSTTDRDYFMNSIARRGMLVPKYMPRGGDRTLWVNFFQQLSSAYRQHFSSISAVIYMSETAFIYKQMPVIEGARGQ